MNIDPEVLDLVVTAADAATRLRDRDPARFAALLAELAPRGNGVTVTQELVKPLLAALPDAAADEVVAVAVTPPDPELTTRICPPAQTLYGLLDGHALFIAVLECGMWTIGSGEKREVYSTRAAAEARLVELGAERIVAVRIVAVPTYEPAAEEVPVAAPVATIPPVEAQPEPSAYTPPYRRDADGEPLRYTGNSIPLALILEKLQSGPLSEEGLVAALCDWDNLASEAAVRAVLRAERVLHPKERAVTSRSDGRYEALLLPPAELPGRHGRKAQTQPRSVVELKAGILYALEHGHTHGKAIMKYLACPQSQFYVAAKALIAEGLLARVGDGHYARPEGAAA